jgi:nucleoside-diphosphate-sugar epimerase
MRIGISGAGGFVGQALLRRLQRVGHDVVPIVRAATGMAGELVLGDLAAAVLPPVLPPLDVVIHLAARTHVGSNAADADEAFRAVNVDGTRAMLALAERTGARRFVFLSSIKVNGEQTRGRAFTELDPPAPEDAYGRSKLEAEELIRAHAAWHGTDFVVLRPPLVYGPGQKGNLRTLAEAVARGIPLPFGRVRNRRSMIHVDNLADLIAVAAEHPRAANRVLLAGDGTIVSTADLIRVMALASGNRARLLPVPTTLISALAVITGRRDQAERLLGDLEIDEATTRELLNWVPPMLPASVSGVVAVG